MDTTQNVAQTNKIKLRHIYILPAWILTHTSSTSSSSDSRKADVFQRCDHIQQKLVVQTTRAPYFVISRRSKFSENNIKWETTATNPSSVSRTRPKQRKHWSCSPNTSYNIKNSQFAVYWDEQREFWRVSVTTKMQLRHWKIVCVENIDWISFAETKAEEKISNIKAAIEVFEKWIETNGGGSANTNEKAKDEDKVETVPGLGFKDKEAAKKTLKWVNNVRKSGRKFVFNFVFRILEGRDPDYQRLAVRGLLGSSKRVLSGTKNEEKINAINDGVRVLEAFIEKFDKENRSKLNMAYLPAAVVSAFKKPESHSAAEFIETYIGKAKGNYKHLRTLFPKNDDSKSWDIVRNRKLNELKEKVLSGDRRLFHEDGSPTSDHLKLIYWAWSPQPDKVKAYVEKLSSKSNDSKKRKSSSESSGSSSSSPAKKKRSK